MISSSIKNVIFDLGGVILDLSVDDTLLAFGDLAGLEKDKVMNMFITATGFEQYEKGEFDDTRFRDLVRDLYNITAADESIDKAWNAMLRGIPLANLQLLKKLKHQYNTFLLSNTNGIHLHHINEIMLPKITGERSLDDYFHKAYYSHRMKKRKPDAEIFEQVLQENGLVAEQTLFLDDNAKNVEGAKTLGIQTVFVTSHNLILELFQ